MMAAEERFILMVTFTVIHLIAVKILLKTNRLTLTNGEGLSQPSVDTHTHTHTQSTLYCCWDFHQQHYESPTCSCHKRHAAHATPESAFHSGPQRCYYNTEQHTAFSGLWRKLLKWTTLQPDVTNDHSSCSVSQTGRTGRRNRPDHFFCKSWQQFLQKKSHSCSLSLFLLRS